MRDFHLPGRSAVFAANGMCATSHPLAAACAIDMLKSGGNAVDAAITTAAMLTICEPHMCGLAGDAFVLVKPAGEERVIGLNGSGRAPAALSAAEMRARGLRQIPVDAIESVTLPGAVDAFCRLSERFGRRGLDACLAPAIAYAEAGVPVAPRVAFDWARESDPLKGRARELYLDGGRAPKTGALFRQPGLAEVMRRIAREGRAGFYEGEVAEDMLASLRALGGCHTGDDLAATASDWTEPVASGYGGVELFEHPPNGQGATANLLLNILSHFDLAAMDPFGAERAHIEAEAGKLAYAMRDRLIADPGRGGGGTAEMLDPSTAERLAALIDPQRAMPGSAARAGAEHRDTVYLTVVDRDRMAVSLIFSIYFAFGSGLASERFGLLFQNRGAGFTLEEGHPNEAAGGKRPMHTIIPAMLKEAGRVSLPFGVMGGGYQPCGHARFVSNMVDFGLRPQAAIDAPRAFATDGVLRLERGHEPAVARALAELGHEVVVPDGPLGGAQAVRIDHVSGVLEGASDPRKDGCALGY